MSPLQSFKILPLSEVASILDCLLMMSKTGLAAVLAIETASRLGAACPRYMLPIKIQKKTVINCPAG